MTLTTPKISCTLCHWTSFHTSSCCETYSIRAPSSRCGTCGLAPKTAGATAKPDLARAFWTPGKAVQYRDPRKDGRRQTRRGGGGSDTTCVAVDERWLCLTAALDLYSRLAAGKSMLERMTSTFYCNVLSMALCRRQTPRGVIVHADLGIRTVQRAISSR